MRPDTGLARRSAERAERAETPFDMLLDAALPEQQPSAEPPVRRSEDAVPAPRDSARREPTQPGRETQAAQPNKPPTPTDVAPAKEAAEPDAVAEAPKGEANGEESADAEAVATAATPDPTVVADAALPQPNTTPAPPPVAAAIPTNVTAPTVTTVPEGAVVSDIEATTAPTGGTAVPAAPAPTADAAAPAPSAPTGDTAAPAPPAPSAPAAAPALAEPSASQPAPAAATVPATPKVSEQPAVAPIAADAAVPEKPAHETAKPARTESPAWRVATSAPSTTQATPATPNTTKAPAPQPAQPVASDGEPSPSTGTASPVATDEPAHKPKAAHAPVPGEPAGTPPAHAANERSVAFSALPSNATPTAPDAAPNGGLQAVAGVTAPQAAQAAAAMPANAQALPYAAPVPVAGLAVEIVARAKEGLNRFEIRLDPPEFGRIDVHLRVDREGNVSSRLIVERTETLDLLRRDAPALERALQNAGLKTGEQGLEFSLRDQMAGRDHQDRQDGSRANRIVIADDEVQPAAGALNQYGRLTGLGTGIDIRV